MNFTNGEALLEYCNNEGKKISEAMFERELTYIGQPEETVRERMVKAWDIMKAAVKKPMSEELDSMGGLIGGGSRKLNNLRLAGGNICGDLVSKAIAYAMGVLEVNASMGLIVAAPTAGSSGVLPGVLCAIMEEYDFSDDDIIRVLYNASAVGYLITHNATTAGAEGGCQAEVGSAAAMAASAAVELLGGSPDECLDAASFALVNLMGLICDPVGGLVEYPCQLRNAIGAADALTAAEIALAGIKSLTPIDETIAAMYSVGRSLPVELKETSLGGIAVSKSACEACRKAREKQEENTMRSDI